MREKVRKRLYLMTLHAEEEMDNDGLTVYDVESIILTGRSSNDSATARPGSASTWSVERRWRARKRLSSSVDGDSPTSLSS
jgi:hypothetical protein